MNLRTAILSISIPALLVVGGASFALQGKDKGAAAGAAQGDNMPEMPKPTKEHEWLKTRVGTWDATVSCPKMGVSKGTETNEAMGDFWIVSHFSGDMGGMPFKGLGVNGYDPNEKKFVQTWCDSMSPMLMVMKGTLDSTGKKLTTTGKSQDMMSGQIVDTTFVYEMKGPDAATFMMYQTDKGPESQDAMKIEYMRHK